MYYLFCYHCGSNVTCHFEPPPPSLYELLPTAAACAPSILQYLVAVAVVASDSFKLLLFDVEPTRPSLLQRLWREIRSLECGVGFLHWRLLCNSITWLGSPKEEPLTTLPSKLSPKGMSPNSVRLMRDSPLPLPETLTQHAVLPERKRNA